jgi:hypothetical protein
MKDSEFLHNSFIESHAAFYLEQSRAVVLGQRQPGRAYLWKIHSFFATYASTKEVPRAIWKG